MRPIPNVIRLVFGGPWPALGHLINCVVSTVAIPFGVVSLPFGLTGLPR